MSIPFWTLTAESVTVIDKGNTYSFQKGTPNYDAISLAITSGHPENIVGHLTVASSIEHWAKGGFTVTGEKIFYKGEPLPVGMNQRIVACAGEGKDPTFLFRFWENLQLNPSKRSVDQLWDFLKHLGIPVTEDGCFLAYKGVRSDWKDVYSGTIDNKVGALVDYPRNKISDDPREACHEGLHVGAISYARTFGDSDNRVVICKVNPKDVVSVPYDYSCMKMRVCHYEVVGLYAGLMPSTTIDTEDVPTSNENVSSAGRIWGDFNLLDRDGLLGKSLDLLRKYAGIALKIAGATKILGGKEALVSRILDVRDNRVYVAGVTGGHTTDLENGAYDATHPKSEGTEPLTPEEEEPSNMEPTSDFPEFDAMCYERLLECSLGDLRKYATYGVKMVGASKVPGGKDALVRRILSSRD